eukprot:TRINITY_DN1165_c0_g2_i13.p9 TRINITY_DN1165_c0_g2~~TRINITY_DN1165_c0_g2_i13.p9  ORF type:complete len:127 (-),score=4.19 TRINITY_DN1165_c0_g2_i13:1594-1974(-)
MKNELIIRYQILGSRRFSNFFWATLILLSSISFILTGISSYLNFNILPFIHSESVIRLFKIDILQKKLVNLMLSSLVKELFMNWFRLKKCCKKEKNENVNKKIYKMCNQRDFLKTEIQQDKQFLLK